MNGIASLLNDPHKTQIEAIWHELDEKCGLIGVRVTPFPHVTYQVVETYDQAKLEPILQEVAKNTQPFKVQTTGLGIFTGEVPVLYLPLVKNDILLNLHTRIWEQTKEIALGVSPYYAPDLWVPHITLAYGDITHFNVTCAIDTLVFRKYDWNVDIDNITFIGQQGQNSYGSFCTYHFGE